MTSLTRTRSVRLSALALVGVLALATLPAHASDDRETRRTISITGEADVSAAPDMAMVSAGASNQARTVREAMEQTNRAVAATLAALKEIGIPERDVATSGISLLPTIEYAANTNRPRVTGYTATNMLTIRVADLGKLGDVLDRAVLAGANQINGVSLGVTDLSKKLDDARRAAVDDARRRATLLLTAAGARLGRIVSVDDSGSARPRPMATMDVASARMRSPTPVATGDQQLKISVSTVWEIAD